MFPDSKQKLFKDCTHFNLDYILYGDSCYKSYSLELDWDEAEAQCQKDHSSSHLLSIIDGYENAFIRYWTQHELRVTKFWIGLKPYHFTSQVFNNFKHKNLLLNCFN